jgi:hypothetical protein
MVSLRQRRFLGLVLGLSLLVACDDDESTPPPAPPLDGDAACKELGSKCHAGDTGSGLIAECHDIGHVEDPDVCLAKYDECMAVCMVDGGHGGAGGDDHGEGGESHGGAGGESHGGAGGESDHG